MFSSSSVRSTFRRASALLLALLPSIAAASVPADRNRTGDIDQAWYRLVEVLDPLDPELLQERTDELVQVSSRLELERLTPLALALVARARTLPPAQAEQVLVQATRLDPGSAEAWFAVADARLRKAALFPAVPAFAHGCGALVRDLRSSAVVGSGFVISLLIVLLAGLGLWSVLAVRHAFLRLWHDLNELAARWRLGAHGPVFAVVVLTLPLFIGGDPLWLLLWLLALSWAYLPAAQRFFGVLALALTAATPTVLELAFGRLTHPPNAVYQGVYLLAEHRYEPQVLEELVALGDLFADDADFRRLQGDCYRQTGLLDSAAWAYREGLRLAPGNGPLSLGLGTIHYLQGDFNSAVAALQVARDAGADPLASNYNLSLTYAQTYHFRESDEAIAAARQAGEARLRSLTRGREHQLLLPAFSAADARSLLDRKDPVLLLNRGVLSPPLIRERTFFHPLTVASLLALVIAIAGYLARERTIGFATACVKCGRPFCRYCKLSQESQSYCTQCVNIFLKKDMVAVDAQLAKRRQLRRFHLARRIERRVTDVLLPGLGVALGGRPLIGFPIMAVAATCLTIALLWLPKFVAPALLHVSLGPVELAAGVGWLACAVVAQVVETERR